MSDSLLRKVDGLYSGRVSPLGAAAVAASAAAVLAGAAGAVGLLAAGAGLACTVWVTVVVGVAAGAPTGAAQAVKPTTVTAAAAAANIRDLAFSPCVLLNTSFLPVPSGRCPVWAPVRQTVGPSWPRSHPGIYQ